MKTEHIFAILALGLAACGDGEIVDDEKDGTETSEPSSSPTSEPSFMGEPTLVLQRRFGDDHEEAAGRRPYWKKSCGVWPFARRCVRDSLWSRAAEEPLRSEKGRIFRRAPGGRTAPREHVLAQTE